MVWDQTSEIFSWLMKAVVGREPRGLVLRNDHDCRVYMYVLKLRFLTRHHERCDVQSLVGRKEDNFF